MELQNNQNSWRNTENEEQSQRYHTLISTLQSYSDSDSDGKEFACNVGDLGLIPGLRGSPGEGKATHSSILAWRICGLKELDMTERLSLSGHLPFIGIGLLNHLTTVSRFC